MADDTTTILIVEDDDHIAELVREQLEFELYGTSRALTGAEALEAVSAGRPDLVILDLGLPDQSGFEVCRELRKASPETPLLVLTARKNTADKVRALDLGADDYLTKPFEVVEFLARVRALLRRSSSGSPAGDHVRLGSLAIDFRRRVVQYGGVEVVLTTREFEILLLLASRSGEVVSRDQLLEELWPGIIVTPRTVDVHIASLRKKLETQAGAPELIASVRGIGYKLSAQAP